MLMSGKNGKTVRGYERFKPETKYKQKLEKYNEKEKELRNNYLNWVDVSNMGNF